ILHPHAEGARQPRHLLADGAETDDAESLAVDFVHARCRAVAAPTSARNIGMLRDHAPRHHEHQHHGMLCYRDGVSAAVVGNQHLGAARSLEIDVVVAGAEQLVQTEAGGGTIEGVAGVASAASSSVCSLRTMTSSNPDGASVRASSAISAKVGGTTTMRGRGMGRLMRNRR